MDVHEAQIVQVLDAALLELVRLEVARQIEQSKEDVLEEIRRHTA